MAAPARLRVTRNQWGNMRGFLPGSRLGHELGCEEHRATVWLLEALEAHPGATVHPNSYITTADVERLRARLAKWSGGDGA